MKYDFHPEAVADMFDAAVRYESEVQGLGKRFRDEIDRVIQLLLERPELGVRVDDVLRHFVLRRFPFLVIYSASPDLLYVVAVAHWSRDPGFWQYRVQDG